MRSTSKILVEFFNWFVNHEDLNAFKGKTADEALAQFSDYKKEMAETEVKKQREREVARLLHKEEQIQKSARKYEQLKALMDEKIRRRSETIRMPRTKRQNPKKIDLLLNELQENQKIKSSENLELLNQWPERTPEYTEEMVLKIKQKINKKETSLVVLRQKLTELKNASFGQCSTRNSLQSMKLLSKIGERLREIEELKNLINKSKKAE